MLNTVRPERRGATQSKGNGIVMFVLRQAVVLSVIRRSPFDKLRANGDAVEASPRTV